MQGSVSDTFFYLHWGDIVDKGVDKVDDDGYSVWFYDI